MEIISVLKIYRRNVSGVMAVQAFSFEPGLGGSPRVKVLALKCLRQ